MLKRSAIGRVWKACGLAARTCLRACVLKLSGIGRVWKARGLAARTCLRACVLKAVGHWKGLEGVRASSPHLPKGLCVESGWALEGFGRRAG